MENLKRYFDEYAAASLRGSAEEVAGFDAQSFLVAFAKCQAFLAMASVTAVFKLINIKSYVQLSN